METKENEKLYNNSEDFVEKIKQIMEKELNSEIVNIKENEITANKYFYEIETENLQKYFVFKSEDDAKKYVEKVVSENLLEKTDLEEDRIFNVKYLEKYAYIDEDTLQDILYDIALMREVDLEYEKEQWMEENNATEEEWKNYVNNIIRDEIRMSEKMMKEYPIQFLVDYCGYTVRQALDVVTIDTDKLLKDLFSKDDWKKVISYDGVLYEADGLVYCKAS